MCGIAGFVRYSGENLGEDSTLLEKMTRSIFYRGPDAAGFGLHDGVAFGMRRLKIIDLAGGSQPIYNEDRTVWCVFNGEIYNYRQLRSELQQRGHRFTTESDTEVIVHGYEEWGDRFVEHLNGMFAIALHDRKNRRVLLARDHLGIKPLYFALHKEKLLFGSEIKALLAVDGLQEKKLNINALADFLSWEYVPGRDTLLDGVEKLLPGELLTLQITAGDIKRRKYWDIPFIKDSDKQQLSSVEWEERVFQQIQKSTQMQMVSDVPLGAFLSGGVDSSLIVANMGAVGAAQTFSIGFDDPSYNELAWARKVAEHIGARHIDEIIRPDVLSLFETLMLHFDDPIGDFSIFPTWLVSRLAKKHVTVALSGDGGDELFAGYETLLADQKAQIYQQCPRWLRNNVVGPLGRLLPPGVKKKGLRNKIKRFIEGAGYAESLSHTRWRLFVGELMRQELFTPEALADISRPVSHHIDCLFAEAGERDRLEKSLYVDVRSYLCDNILPKVDRMSMAVSLETRVPLLDKDLVELAFQIPSRFKLEGNETKAILKRVAARVLPRECVYRPKEGFSIPIKHWLNNEFSPLVDQYLNIEEIRAAGIFRPETIARLKEEHRNGSANHSHILWALIVFHSWQRHWL